MNIESTFPLIDTEGWKPEEGNWQRIVWGKVEKVVFRLQKRIYAATKAGQHKKARNLAKLLLRSSSSIILNVRRVTQDNSGKKTAGVDGVKSLTPVQREKLVVELIALAKRSWKGYHARPIRRVYIPKSNGKLRPLGIPTIQDRTVQGIVKTAMEPAFEAEFEPSSYGFRPAHNAQDAIEGIFDCLKGKRKWVLDADIRGCFDNIDHQMLIDKMDSKTKKFMVEQWLKASIMDNQEFHPSELGTPQGGIISPLLANIVLATAVSPDGRVVATGGGSNQEIHLWSLRDGKLQQRLSGVGAAIWAVGFSSDGRELGWGKTSDYQNANQLGPLEYTITLPSKAKANDDRQFLGTPRKLSNTNKAFSRAQDKWRDWTLRTRKGGNFGYQAILDIRQQNRTVASIERGSTDGLAHYSYTFTHDGERIISGGGHGNITIYNREGNKLGDFVGHTGVVWAVAVSSDGRLLVSGSNDQTVRLWDVETRENLLTLFHGSDGEWVAWTPTGHYTASVNGDKMVGWQINRGVDKAADYVTAAQLPNLHRPDVIATAIRLRSVKKAIAQTGAHFNLARLQRELPPRFQIVSPQRGSKMKKGVAPVVLKIAENTLEIQRLAVYVNGRQVTPEKVRKINPIITQHKRTLEVPLENGENRIAIRAKNRLGSTTTQVTVFYEGESQIREGTLHLVSIGVSAYPNLSEKEQLDFAAIDAQAIYNKLMATAQKQYRDVNGVLISDNQGKTPTKSNIETALQALTPKKEDTTILFLAGHGINLDGEYFFMPKGSKRQGSELNKNSLVRWKILQDAIAKSQGRRILLVDTCHAGKAFNPRLLKDAANKNIVVLSATDANTVSRETNKFGHGVFTYALLEGLKGEANIIKFDGGKKITFSELNTYVTGMVKHLTKNRQIPISQASSDGFMDFVFVQL